MNHSKTYTATALRLLVVCFVSTFSVSYILDPHDPTDLPGSQAAWSLTEMQEAFGGKGGLSSFVSWKVKL